jgi:hypothetical protein
MPDEWTEVDLFPPSQRDGLNVLLNVIDPLVNQVLSSRVNAWFYTTYEEPGVSFHLLLRLHWDPPGRLAEDEEKLSQFLETNKRPAGILVDYYEGSHGVKGLTYPGEEAEYGEMWEATYRLWASQSRYALTLIEHESQGTLSKPLPYHWERSVHMLSNCLLLGLADEVYLSANQARGYLARMASPGDPLLSSLTQDQKEFGTRAKGILSDSVVKKFEADFP